MATYHDSESLRSAGNADDCGGQDSPTLLTGSASFATPGQGGQGYNNNMDCYWLLQASFGEVL